jgi:hypothetical protein
MIAVGALAAIWLLPSLLHSQCRVSGTAPADDLARARSACERAADRFQLLFGVAAPPGTVAVSDTIRFFAVESRSPEWKIVWPNSEKQREFFADQSADAEEIRESVELQWVGVLPHEIGHLMLSAADARRAPGSPPRRLPDWLQEGVAVWMEWPSYRESDYGILRALRPYIPPADALLEHVIPQDEEDEQGGSVIVQTFFPCASEEACGGRPYWSRIFSVTTRQFPDGRVQVDTTFLSAPPPPPDPMAANFYTYAAALIRYVYDRGGPPAMRALLEHPTSLMGLPGLPPNRSRLESDWREWFTQTFHRYQ